jgi:hypothetical protein
MNSECCLTWLTLLFRDACIHDKCSPSVSRGVSLWYVTVECAAYSEKVSLSVVTIIDRKLDQF